MRLTNREMARLGELLDKSLPINAEAARRLARVAVERGPAASAHSARCAACRKKTGARGPLDRPPRIEPRNNTDEEGCGPPRG